MAPHLPVPPCGPRCPIGASTMCVQPRCPGRAALPGRTAAAGLVLPGVMPKSHPCGRGRCTAVLRGPWVACLVCADQRFTDEVWCHPDNPTCYGPAGRGPLCPRYDEGCPGRFTDEGVCFVEALPPARYQTLFMDALFQQCQARVARACALEFRAARAAGRDPVYTDAMTQALLAVPNHPEIYAAG